MIKLLKNGNLIVQKRGEYEGTIGDFFIEIEKGDIDYEKYYSQYLHDLKIEKEKEKILNN